MDLGQCLENLKYDVSNGGLEDDTFPMICYITMANEARRLLGSDVSDQREANYAREYLALCGNSGSASLRCVVEG